MSEETFSRYQTALALSQILAYAEQEEGKSHMGYFSGQGFAARCLCAHLAELEKEEPK